MTKKYSSKVSYGLLAIVFVVFFSFLLVCLLLTGNQKVEATTIEFTEDTAVNINEFHSFTNIVVFIRFADETDYVAPYDLAYYINMFNILK